MAKPTAVWGIDIGQCALKALKLELDESGNPIATAFDYIEHPKILSQPDADADQLTRESLEKFLSRNQLGNDLVAISVPGQSGLARFVKLPPVEPSKIADIVRFEAKQQIPFPLDEVVWDYQTISGGEVINNFAMETEIGLFAMKREVIAKHMGQFNQMNIEVNVVQMAPLALCNYATWELLGKGGPNPVEAPANDDTPRGKKRCVVVLDVGTDASNLIITDAGKIIWQRPLPLGGNHFTRALTKEMKLTFAKAEHLKRNAAKSPDLAQILKSLRPVLTDFVGEVQRSLGYFTNTHRDAHVAHLVGLGSAFRLPGLQKYMSEKLSLEVKRPTTVERLGGDAVKNDPVFTDNLLTFPVAYGLALQALNELGERKDYGRLNTNLLPPQLKMERLIRAKKPWAAAAAAALLLGTGGLALGYGAQYASVNDKKLETSMKAADAAVKAATGQTTEKTNGESEIAKTQADVKAIIKGNESRLDMVRLNEVLLAALPRHGPQGNLNDPERAPFANTPEGQRAYELYKERIRKGVTLDQIAEDDKAEFLANVQIESVYMAWTDNLKGFLELADAETAKNFGRNIAEDMLESEREMNTATPPRLVPKGPEGGGFVVQISGHTMHEGKLDFLKKALVKNFARSAAFAEATLERLVDEKGQPIDEVGYFLPGVSDPVKGRVSHAFLLQYRQVENPQPKVFALMNQRFIDSLMPQPGEAGAPSSLNPSVAPAGIASEGTAASFAGTPAAMVGGPGAGAINPGAAAAAASSSWSPFSTAASAPTPTIPDNPSLPTSPASPSEATSPGKAPKKKYRQEFVLCFLWRNAPGTAPPAAPAP